MSAGFLGLHALATPGVLLGKNAGFELATPVGLIIASAFAALSAIEFGPLASTRILRIAPFALGAVAAIFLAWGVVSLAKLPPLDAPLAQEQLDGWQLALAGVGIAFYVARGARLPPPLPAAQCPVRDRGHGRVRAARRGDDRDRVGAQLARVVVGMAPADARVVPPHRRDGAHASGTKSASARSTSTRRSPAPATSASLLARPERLHVVLGAARSGGRHGDAERVLRRDRAADGGERGEVHQIVGDELMVIFNKQGDTPDHPLRAARAALTLSAHGGSGRHARQWPRFRVGVNSGTAVAAVVGGATGHRKHGIVGDAVNIAARLEAPPRRRRPS